MKYYVIIVGIDAVLYLLQFEWYFFVFAVVESYIFICSYSLYLVCLSSSQDDGGNKSENTVIRNEHDPAPPPYDSTLENNMQAQGQTTGAYPKLYP